MALPMQRCWAKLRALTLPWSAAGYHAKSRTLGFNNIYKPDPNDPETKSWHKGPTYMAKLYGRHGSASGVNPASLWPSPEQLQAIQEEEKEWCPSLREMQERLEAKEKELKQKEKERVTVIPANLPASVKTFFPQWAVAVAMDPTHAERLED